MANQISRRFFYYGSNVYKVVGNEEKRISDYATTLRQVFKEIKELKYSNTNFDENHLFYKKKDGTFIYINVDESVDLDTCSKIRFQLIQCRNNLLPCIEENGVLTPLKDLLKGRNQKLAEITHCVLFLNERVLAMEYNYAGAKKPELVLYLKEKISNNVFSNISFENLLNNNVLNRLTDEGTLSLLKIKVRQGSNVAKKLADTNDVFKGLSVKNDEIDYVEVVLRAHTNKKKKGFKLEKFNKSFIRKILKENKEDIDCFNMKYERGTEEIDLLDRNYVCKAEFVAIDRTKMINSEDAYKKMEDFYNERVLHDMRG